MECGKQIVAPSCHGLQKSVSRLGDEWAENKAGGKEERSQFGAGGQWSWYLEDEGVNEAERRGPGPPVLFGFGSDGRSRRPH